MWRVMLKSKIHRVKVTDANIDYEGSITIDAKLLKEADIYEHEKVQVVDINNGVRIETYTIAGREGTGEICLNGAAARLIKKGDLIIILSYAIVEEEKAKDYKSKVVLVDAQNQIKSVGEYQALFDLC